jgi:hypothetical protein
MNISQEANQVLEILKKWSDEKHIYCLFAIEEMEIYPGFDDTTKDTLLYWLDFDDGIPSNVENVDFSQEGHRFYTFSETDIDTYLLWFYPGLEGEPPVLKLSDGGTSEVIASSMAEFACRLGRNLADEYLDDLAEDYGFSNDDKALKALFDDYAKFKLRIAEVLDCTKYSDHQSLMKRHPILIPQLTFVKVDTDINVDNIMQLIGMPLDNVNVLNMIVALGYEVPLYPLKSGDFEVPERKGISFYFDDTKRTDTQIKEDRETLYLHTISFNYDCEFLPFDIKDTDEYKVVLNKLKSFEHYYDADPEYASTKYWFVENDYYVRVDFEDDDLKEVSSIEICSYESPEALELKKA